MIRCNLLVANAYADLTRLDLFRLRNFQTQDTIVQRSLDRITLDGRRQCYRTLERAIAALDTVIVALTVLMLLAHLSLDCQNIVLERYLKILWFQARHRCLNDIAVTSLAHVHRRYK